MIGVSNDTRARTGPMNWVIGTAEAIERELVRTEKLLSFLSRAVLHHVPTDRIDSSSLAGRGWREGCRSPVIQWLLRQTLQGRPDGRHCEATLKTVHERSLSGNNAIRNGAPPRRVISFSSWPWPRGISVHSNVYSRPKMSWNCTACQIPCQNQLTAWTVKMSPSGG